MELQKLLHLIVLIVGVIVAFVLIAFFLKVAVNLLQLALVVAVILVLYFGAERLFGKGRR
jgi:ABC-type uncharacterized transport system permease subunit